MANRFYLITKGRVLLDLNAKASNSNLVHEVADGDVLGWSWLFPPYYWHCDAHAAETTEAIFFYGTRLREQFRTKSGFRPAIDEASGGGCNQAIQTFAPASIRAARVLVRLSLTEHSKEIECP